VAFELDRRPTSMPAVSPGRRGVQLRLARLRRTRGLDRASGCRETPCPPATADYVQPEPHPFHPETTFSGRAVDEEHPRRGQQPGPASQSALLLGRGRGELELISRAPAISTAVLARVDAYAGWFIPDVRANSPTPDHQGHGPSTLRRRPGPLLRAPAWRRARGPGAAPAEKVLLFYGNPLTARRPSGPLAGGGRLHVKRLRPSVATTRVPEPLRPSRRQPEKAQARPP